MPECQDETLVTVPGQPGYAGIRIGVVPYEGGEVAVLRYTQAAQAASGRSPRYCIVGYSHWNPADFFLRNAENLEREAALHRAAAATIERHEAGL